MENKENTIRLLTKMFADCFRFWINEGRGVKESLSLALMEISEMTHNPFEPQGDLLNIEGKQECIKIIKKELNL